MRRCFFGLLTVLLVGTATLAQESQQSMPKVEPIPSDRDQKKCLPSARPQTSYLLDTSCAVVALFCNYCEYKEDGTFLRRRSTLCGGCFSSGF